MISDHRPLWAELCISGAQINPSDSKTPFRPLSLRTPPTGNKTQQENYKKLVEEKILQLPSSLSPSNKLLAIADISVNSCPKSRQHKSFYNSTRVRGGWSIHLLAGLSALTAIAKMRQHSAGDNKRRQWRTPMDISTGIKEACDEWERKLAKISWPTEESRVKAFAWGLGPWHWKLLTEGEYGSLTTKLREQEKSIKSHLHGRQRREMRMTVNAATAAREKARAEGRLTGVIRSICGTHVEQYSLHQLKLPNGETTTDPLIIHDAHTEHWKKWLGGAGNSTFFDHYEIDWDDPQNLREEFLTFPSHIPIPIAIRVAIWEALTVPQYDDALVKQRLIIATSRTVTLADLQAAISRSPKKSVPSPSGLSYVMMKEWTPATLQEAHSAITIFWET